MNEMLDFYLQQAQINKAEKPWLAQLQTNALSDLARQGFPTRHDEEWKYTQVGSLLEQSFELQSIEHDFIPDRLAPMPVQKQFYFYNGVSAKKPEWLNKLPDGVILLPLSEALSQHEDLVKPYLGSILQTQHGFHFLNTAMIQYGVFLYIPAGISIDEPIAVRYFHDQNNQAAYYRNLVVVEKQSKVVLVEDFNGLADCSYCTNTVTEIYLGACAELTHYKIQNESKSAYHIGHLAIQQSTSSNFLSHSLSLGGKLVRSDITVNLANENSHCLMNGIYAPSEGQHIDHHTMVHHKVPHCTSNQDYKGILNGHARAVFNGKVLVAKDAQHTDAKQSNKNLLLSANAEIDTKPQLEIYADDVLCTHGATVGQLDEEALFYLATRGIGREEAAYYLISAFAKDNLGLIANKQLADWMGTLLTKQLEYKHGH